METVLEQNRQLRAMISEFETENNRFREANQQHESQIETLIKFNERLLLIIESELSNRDNGPANNNPTTSGNQMQGKSSGFPLGAISEKSEMDSDAIGSFKSNSFHNLKLDNRMESNGVEVVKKRATLGDQPIPNLPPLNLIERDDVQEVSERSSFASGILNANGSGFKRNQRQAARGVGEKFQQIYALISLYREDIDLGPLRAIGNSGVHNPLRNSEKYIHLRNDFQLGMKEYSELAHNGIRFCEDKIVELDEIALKLSKFEPAKKLQMILRDAGRARSSSARQL